MDCKKRLFELYRGEQFLGLVTLATGEGDFPWLVGYLEPSPEYAQVKPLFDQEAELMHTACESDSIDEELWEAADEILEEILKPGLKMRFVNTGEWEEVIGISIDANRVAWR